MEAIAAVDANSLKIARIANDSEVVAASFVAADDAVLAGAAYTAPTTGVTEIASGAYSVNVNINGATSTATASLMDANGRTLATKSFNYGTTQAVNFENGASVTLDVGLTSGAHESGTFEYERMGDYLVDVDVDDAQGFADYMDTVQSAMNVVNAEMAKVGALTGRMTFKEDQISAAQINTEAAYNRIMNANMAEEQVNASKFQILQQTATAMLAQANAAPQFLLSLFK
jgi:flagellin